MWILFKMHQCFLCSKLPARHKPSSFFIRPLKISPVSKCQVDCEKRRMVGLWFISLNKLILQLTRGAQSILKCPELWRVVVACWRGLSSCVFNFRSGSFAFCLCSHLKSLKMYWNWIFKQNKWEISMDSNFWWYVEDTKSVTSSYCEAATSRPLVWFRRKSKWRGVILH